ncbi:ParA family protein [Ornithobacterium rhinotracheale]
MNFLIMSQKGGVGKSTISLNLAIILNDFKPTGIVDFDEQGTLFRNREIIKSKYNVEVTTKEKGFETEVQNIVFDTPPYMSVDLDKLISAADYIIIPTKEGIFDLSSIQDTLDLVRKHKKENVTSILLNAVDTRSTLKNEARNYLKENNSDFNVFKTEIPDLKTFTRSLYQNLDKKGTSYMKNVTIEMMTNLK